MSQHRSQFRTVRGKEVAHNQKCTVKRRRRTQPSFQCEVQSLPNGTDTYKNCLETGLGVSLIGAGMESLLIEPVGVSRQFRRREAFVDEGLARKLGRA